MPRDVSLSDSKCWNGGHEWVCMVCTGCLYRSSLVNIFLYIYLENIGIFWISYMFLKYIFFGSSLHFSLITSERSERSSY